MSRENKEEGIQEVKMVMVVIDTSILISALLTPGKVRRTFLNESIRPHAPKKIILETLKHIDKISEYTGIPEDILSEILPTNLPAWATVIEEELIPPRIRERAQRLAKTVDPDDWPFIALSIYLDAPLWTGDKDLIRLSLETGEFRALDTRALEILLETGDWRRAEEHLRKMYGGVKNLRTH